MLVKIVGEGVWNHQPVEILKGKKEIEFINSGVFVYLSKKTLVFLFVFSLFFFFNDTILFLPLQLQDAVRDGPYLSRKQLDAQPIVKTAERF